MRLDKFLKVSRLIKRRTVANEACDAGRVTVNGTVAKASVKVKVGDIISDIKEGVNSGVWSVGVIEGSSELGLSREEWEALFDAERSFRVKQVEDSFRSAGAHFVVKNMSELSPLIQMLGI